MAMGFDPRSMLGALDRAQLDALVDTMVLAAAADGEIAAEEQQALASRLHEIAEGSPQGATLSGDSLASRIAFTHERISSGGRADVVAAVRTTLRAPNHRKAALGLAVVVAAADGIIRTSERELILELSEALELEPDQAADLVRDVTRD